MGPPGLEPGTYGLKVHAQAETMTSEAYIYWDSGLTVSRQALPQTPFRVTFDVTRRLGRDRQWLPLTVGPRTSSETDRALPAAGRLGAGEPLLRGAQPGIVQVEELRYPDAELAHLLHPGLQLRRRFLALTFASLRAASRQESAASSCFVPVAGGAGAGGVEETSVAFDRAAHFCGEAVVTIGLGRDDLAAVFGDRGAEGVA